jgi:hypothetical protein
MMDIWKGVRKMFTGVVFDRADYYRMMEIIEDLKDESEHGFMGFWNKLTEDNLPTIDMVIVVYQPDHPLGFRMGTYNGKTLFLLPNKSHIFLVSLTKSEMLEKITYWGMLSLPIGERV